jgi:hypothetical protein
MATPVKALKKFHGDQRDWSATRAITPERREAIAKFYEEAPEDAVPDAEVRRAYEALIGELDKQYSILTDQLGIKIEYTDDDPYANYAEMLDDFLSHNRLKILKTEATGGHPYLTNEQNDKFRAVHDAFGHLGTGRAFDRHGEEAAYQAHLSMFSTEAAKAAATELRGQNAFLIQRGYFGPQKVLLLPEELRKRLAALVRLLKARRQRPAMAQASSDADNAYDVTGSHHASLGRVFHIGPKSARDRLRKAILDQ